MPDTILTHTHWVLLSNSQAWCIAMPNYCEPASGLVYHWGTQLFGAKYYRLSGMHLVSVPEYPYSLPSLRDENFTVIKVDWANPILLELDENGRLNFPEAMHFKEEEVPLAPHPDDEIPF